MSMQELVKIKRYVDEMKIKHAQAITRQQNLESEFIRELTNLQKEYDWAKRIEYKNTELTTDTSESEYHQWENTFRSALSKLQETLEKVVAEATKEKDSILEDMKAILRKEGYDV